MIEHARGKALFVQDLWWRRSSANDFNRACLVNMPGMPCSSAPADSA
jgi:hypothetical protein